MSILQPCQYKHCYCCQYPRTQPRGLQTPKDPPWVEDVCKFFGLRLLEDPRTWISRTLPGKLVEQAPCSGISCLQRSPPIHLQSDQDHCCSWAHLAQMVGAGKDLTFNIAGYFFTSFLGGSTFILMPVGFKQPLQPPPPPSVVKQSWKPSRNIFAAFGRGTDQWTFSFSGCNFSYSLKTSAPLMKTWTSLAFTANNSFSLQGRPGFPAEAVRVVAAVSGNPK